MTPKTTIQIEAVNETEIHPDVCRAPLSYRLREATTSALCRDCLDATRGCWPRTRPAETTSPSRGMSDAET